MSLTLSEVIWRCHRGGFPIPDTEELKQSPHKENIPQLPQKNNSDRSSIKSSLARESRYDIYHF